jgi:peptidyl-dipeptidase Dcp
MLPCHRIFLVSALVLIAACTATEPPAMVNPILAEWDTPHGVPPFDQIQEEHYLPAFHQAMAEQIAEIDAIVANEEPATFANTIEAFERTGKSLTKASNAFFPVESAHSNDAIREIASTIAPELSAHGDSIRLNEGLYARVRVVFDQRDELDLTPEQLRLLEETNKLFVRGGIALEAEAKTRLVEINGELAELGQQFGQNLLAETNAFELHVTDEADLGTLPESLRALAAEEAVRRGHDSGWSFTLQRPSINPFLQYSLNRNMRRQLYEGYALRGDNDNEHDNKAILSRMAALRAERAALMGYETHAAYVLEDNMAETPERVYAFLDQIWAPTVGAMQAERDALQAMMNAEGVEGELEGWDWRHYSEKVRKARYDLDEQELRPYFEVNNVRDGVFMVAGELYGLTFHQLQDMPVWHPDQQVFEVKEADGSHLGIVYLDFFARESKSGGAWMNDLRAQSRLDGEVTPIVTTNFNYPPPTANSPSLLSPTEAATLFHEFGHALHGLMSDVTYESLSGTNVPRDFVEFGSQVMENWFYDPDVLRTFAVHYETGEPIPDELVTKMAAASTFNQGFITAEYLAASYLDLAWHMLDEPLEHEARAFETAETDRLGLIRQIIPRYRSPYFSHIFAGGYSAGYYSYIWAEVLDKDAFQAFKETSLYDQETAARLRRMLSQGGSRPGMDLYREFRGRDPEIDPLLEARGLTGS